MTVHWNYLLVVSDTAYKQEFLTCSYLDWVQAKKHDTFHFENEAQNGYVRWDPEFNIHVFHRMY